MGSALGRDTSGRGAGRGTSGMSTGRGAGRGSMGMSTGRGAGRGTSGRCLGVCLGVWFGNIRLALDNVLVHALKKEGPELLLCVCSSPRVMPYHPLLRRGLCARVVSIVHDCEVPFILQGLHISYILL